MDLSDPSKYTWASITPSSSCFDCSSYTASFSGRYHSWSHFSWIHMVPHMSSSVWPLTECLSLSLQTPLLEEIFQCNSFTAEGFILSSCQIVSISWQSSTTWLFHRGLCKHHTKAILKSMKLLIYKSMVPNKYWHCLKENTPNAGKKNLNEGILTGNSAKTYKYFIF